MMSNNNCINKRSFATKISKISAADIRNRAAEDLRSGINPVTNQILHGSTLEQAVNPNVLVDQQTNSTEVADCVLHLSEEINHDFYESALSEGSKHGNKTLAGNNVRLRKIKKDFMEILSVFDYPSRDVEVKIVTKRLRTVGHVLPKEAATGDLNAHVANCLACYTSDFVTSQRRFAPYSTSHSLIQQSLSEFSLSNFYYVPSSNHVRDREDAQDDDGVDLSRPEEVQLCESGYIYEIDFSDKYVQNNVLWSEAPSETGTKFSQITSLNPDCMERMNFNSIHKRVQMLSTENSYDIMPISPLFLRMNQDERSRSSVVPRLPSEMPIDKVNHRLLVTCNKLELGVKIEPIFASMAIYDAVAKCKVSENFYFELNPVSLKRMLQAYTPSSKLATNSPTSAVFNVSKPNNHLFLVVRLEKVLQGETGDTCDPYLKDVNLEKARSNAVDACNRLGKYRMPFAWTAIWLQNVVQGTGGPATPSTHDSSTHECGASFINNTTLDVKSGTCSSNTSHAKNSLERKANSLKRASWSGNGTEQQQAVLLNDELSEMEELHHNYTNFLPVTLTVSSFFKQEGEKLKDEDLFKYLIELKRPTTALKKLKCIRGELKLDIAVASDRVKNCVTPDLVGMVTSSGNIVGSNGGTHSDSRSSGVMCMDLLEFTSPTSSPSSINATKRTNYAYRNLMFVRLKSVNLTRNLDTSSARNIAVKVELIDSENDLNNGEGLPVIFERFHDSFVADVNSSYLTHIYSSVTYHNKTPDFYEEIKLKIPPNLKPTHHLLFSFYHISCQNQKSKSSDSQSTPTTESVIGYSWLPIFANKQILSPALYNLPICVEYPSSNARTHMPNDDVSDTSASWLDNKKSIFEVEISIESTVYSCCEIIDTFLQQTAHLRLGSGASKQQNIASICEDKVLRSLDNILDISSENFNSLVNFAPLILDKLLLLIVQTSKKLSNAAFRSICFVVHKICSSSTYWIEDGRRNEILSSYIDYQAHLPHPTSNSSHQSPSNHPSPPSHPQKPQLVHEQLVQEWTFLFQKCSRCDEMLSKSEDENSLNVLKILMKTSWFHFELIVKAMTEYMATTGQLMNEGFRKNKFSTDFEQSLLSLVNMCSQTLSSETPKFENGEILTEFNISFAYFIHDLISIMDRDLIFQHIFPIYFDSNLSKSETFTRFKVDFLRVMSYHEHFLSLNLPMLSGMLTTHNEDFFSVASNRSSGDSLLTSLTNQWNMLSVQNSTLKCAHNGNISPTPSIQSNDSESSFVSHQDTVSNKLLAAAKGSSSSPRLTWWSDSASFQYKSNHFLLANMINLLAESMAQLSNTHLLRKNDSKQNKLAAVGVVGNSLQVVSEMVEVLADLVSSHDVDHRFNKHVRCRYLVSSLYYPLIPLILDNSHILSCVRNCPEATPPKGAGDTFESVLTAISDNVSAIKQMTSGYSHHQHLSYATTQKLLFIFLCILKNSERDFLKSWWMYTFTADKVLGLLGVFKSCLSVFEYKGLDRIRSEVLENSHFRRGGGGGSGTNSTKRSHQSATNNSKKCQTSSVASKSGSTISAEFNLASRNSVTSLNSSNITSTALAERKTAINKKQTDPVLEAKIIATLSHEVSIIVLDMITLLIEIVTDDNFNNSATLGSSKGAKVLFTTNVLLVHILHLLIHMIRGNQSTTLLTQNLFPTLQCFIVKFPTLLFEEDQMLSAVNSSVNYHPHPSNKSSSSSNQSSLCQDLCLMLLRHSSSRSSPSVRSEAASTLYLLMRQNFEIGNNFAKVKMQITMSLSQLVGSMTSDRHEKNDQNLSVSLLSFDETCLRHSLKFMLTYAQNDRELMDTSFPDQVQDLVFKLHMILSDTVKMKEYLDDVEMHTDLMYRIAKGYQNSPDLRLTWLDSIATKHEKMNGYAEAAMCKIHCAALISEYLHLMEDNGSYMPIGAVTYEKISPNALEESAVSDDVVVGSGDANATAGLVGGNSSEYYSVTHKFTISNLLSILESSSVLFRAANLYEMVEEVNKIAVPIVSNFRNFRRLSDLYKQSAEACETVHKMQGRRIFGTFFRVGFYGSQFGDLDGEEFIYKEKPLAKLPEISHRLESFYSTKLGSDNFFVIKDSKVVELDKLCSDKAYVQLTYVEPYLEPYELRDRLTPFEKSYNINRFIFSTPFTLSGSAHGELHEQHKRKTILTTSHHFPYVKTRIPVMHRKEIILTPIEVAIEDIENKILELQSAIGQDPPDPKILQMVLQGCIGTTVNQGPIEVANVFLKPLALGKSNGEFIFDYQKDFSTLTKHQNKLRLCFRDFAKRCEDALKLNRKLIQADQKEYQRELEKNFKTFWNKMCHMFAANNSNNEGSTMKVGDLSESGQNLSTNRQSNVGSSSRLPRSSVLAAHSHDFNSSPMI